MNDSTLNDSFFFILFMTLSGKNSKFVIYFRSTFFRSGEICFSFIDKLKKKKKQVYVIPLFVHISDILMVILEERLSLNDSVSFIMALSGKNFRFTVFFGSTFSDQARFVFAFNLQAEKLDIYIIIIPLFVHISNISLIVIWKE